MSVDIQGAITQRKQQINEIKKQNKIYAGYIRKNNRQIAKIQQDIRSLTRLEIDFSEDTG